MQNFNTNRLDYFDNIKWILAIIVINFHSFVHFQEVYPKYSNAFNYVIEFNSSYFMELFFFVSAFFVIPSFLKKGKKEFNKDKIVRLGSGILLVIFAVNQIPDIINNWGQKSIFQLYINEITHGLKPLFDLQWGQFLNVAWFCWVLLVMTLIWSYFTNKEAIQNKPNKPLPSFVTIILFCIFMIPFNCLAMGLMSVLGDDFLGIHLMYYLPTYIAAFIIGIQCYKNQWVYKIDKTYGFFGLVLFLICISFSWSLFPGMTVGSFYYIPLHTGCAIGMCLFIIYVFKTYFNRSNTFTQILARASFPAYLVQSIFLNILFKYAESAVSWNPWAVTLFIGAMATICSFILGIVLNRLPYTRSVF
ncbi:hypothetical protein CF386_09680 [Paraphotobacterium marinum]|uniref:Acyltransferase 3 domain-containing protein n=1 Tax=Paraphotobacterium marinum TaxID=1755811 RepID=A0A220VGF9_9GAMM|nr:acyltransferase [Paraphotobacterium marinum]ASK79326.1 hypothetical protein CF386_09680 [Paraphotobacterium marinum]